MTWMTKSGSCGCGCDGTAELGVQPLLDGPAIGAASSCNCNPATAPRSHASASKDLEANLSMRPSSGQVSAAKPAVGSARQVRTTKPGTYLVWSLRGIDALIYFVITAVAFINMLVAMSKTRLSLHAHPTLPFLCNCVRNCRAYTFRTIVLLAAFNVGLFFAVCAGEALGVFLFSPIGDPAGTAGVTDAACH